MKKIFVLTIPWVTTLFLLAQERASMTAPVVKSTSEAVVLTTRFNDLSAGKDYRVGIGVAGTVLSNVKVELLKNDTTLDKAAVSFDQGYTSNWWNVDKVSVQGFVLSETDLPAKDEKLGMRVTVPRSEVSKFKKLFVLLARKYDSERWYLEDGVELDESYW
ncbi:MAG: hypothetical protein HY645_02930 [Acidobacteria bacterium]|nr:hypothetical protein [Acidobacteriota bacterium]